MDEIISYKMCAVKVRNAKLRNYLNRAPSYIRDADVTIGQFKSYLLKYYHEMTELIYDINVPQSFKTVCVKCHSCRHLSSLVIKCVVIDVNTW